MLIGFSMGAPVVIETAKRVSNQVVGVVLVDWLQDIEMQYSPKVISYLDSVYMDVVTNPTFDKMKPFFRRNTEASFKRVLAMLNVTSKDGWSDDSQCIVGPMRPLMVGPMMRGQCVARVR